MKKFSEPDTSRDVSHPDSGTAVNSEKYFFLCQFLSEDFNGNSLPNGWSIQTQASDNGWIIGNSMQLASENWQIPFSSSILATNDDKCNCNKSADRLIFPTLHFTGSNSVFGIFKIFIPTLLKKRAGGFVIFS